MTAEAEFRTHMLPAVNVSSGSPGHSIHPLPAVRIAGKRPFIAVERLRVEAVRRLIDISISRVRTITRR